MQKMPNGNNKSSGSPTDAHLSRDPRDPQCTSQCADANVGRRLTVTSGRRYLTHSARPEPGAESRGGRAWQARRDGGASGVGVVRAERARRAHVAVVGVGVRTRGAR